MRPKPGPNETNVRELADRKTDGAEPFVKHNKHKYRTSLAKDTQEQFPSRFESR